MSGPLKLCEWRFRRTDLEMSSTRQLNGYSSTAQKLQTLVDVTEEAQLYHEAVRLVLSI